MNFAELRERAELYADVWGYSNTLRKPNWHQLVNKAYRDICWDTDVIRGPEIQFATVQGQREYIIGGPTSVSQYVQYPGNEFTNDATNGTCYQDIKSFLDVSHQTMLRIDAVDENYLRRTDRQWFLEEQNPPRYIWSPRPNVVSLYPSPDVGPYNIILYCVMGPLPLVNDDDLPAFWETYHEAICVRAAYLHSKPYAKGEGREVLAAHDSDYQAYVASMKQEQMEDSGMDTPRFVQWPEPERIFL